MKQRTGKKDKKSKTGEVIIEVTQSNNDEMENKGFDYEELLPPGKHTFRRISPDRFATRADLHPSNTKV